MIDVDTMIGFLVTWIIRDSQRFKGQPRNREIDEALDTLAEIAAQELDPQLISRMRSEVGRTTELRSRTRQHVTSALTKAAESAPGWAEAVNAAIAALQDLTDEAPEPPDPKPPRNTITNTVSGTVHGTVIQAGSISGDISIRRE